MEFTDWDPMEGNERYAVIGHIVAAGEGGSGNISNLCLMHDMCNLLEAYVRLVDRPGRQVLYKWLRKRMKRLREKGSVYSKLGPERRPRSSLSTYSKNTQPGFQLYLDLR
jgi:hypothetical protein